MFAIVVLVIMVGWVAAGVRGSNEVTQRSTELSLADATAGSAAELYRVAVNSGLADESTGYLLDEPALKRLVEQRPETDVVANAVSSNAWGLQPVRVPARAAFAVRDRSQSADQYWQLYEVLEPRRLASGPSNLVVYIRSWNTIPAASGAVRVVDRKIFRVEYSMSTIAEDGLRTDAPIIMGDRARWSIDGPVQSNGHTVVEWLARDASGTPMTGVHLGATTTCGPHSSIRSGGAGQFVAANESCTNARRSGARDVNVLELDSSLGRIMDLCRTPRADVLCPDSPAGTTATPSDVAHDITLQQGRITIDGTAQPLVDNLHNGDSSSLTVVTSRDVNLHGALGSLGGRYARVTIAAIGDAASARPPRVTLMGDRDNGVVGAGDAATSSVGILSRGDIVLGLRDTGCVRAVRGVLVAQSGSVTIPPEYVTETPPAIDTTELNCADPIRFEGSMVSHGQFLPQVAWNDQAATTIGYSDISIEPQPAFVTGIPPNLPNLRPWSVESVSVADDACFEVAEMSSSCS